MTNYRIKTRRLAFAGSILCCIAAIGIIVHLSLRTEQERKTFNEFEFCGKDCNDSFSILVVVAVFILLGFVIGLVRLFSISLDIQEQTTPMNFLTFSPSVVFIPCSIIQQIEMFLHGEFSILVSIQAYCFVIFIFLILFFVVIVLILLFALFKCCYQALVEMFRWLLRCSICGKLNELFDATYIDGSMMILEQNALLPEGLQECSICLQNLRNNVAITINDTKDVDDVNNNAQAKEEEEKQELNLELSQLSQCKHIFHTQCIQRWLDLNQICPLCRDPQPH